MTQTDHGPLLTLPLVSVDITEGIPKQSSINFCRNCSRYLSPPQSWVGCELESRELLSICLRKLRVSPNIIQEGEKAPFGLESSAVG